LAPASLFLSKNQQFLININKINKNDKHKEVTKMVEENRTIDSIIRGNLVNSSFSKQQLESFRKEYDSYSRLFRNFVFCGFNMDDAVVDAVTKAFDYNRFIGGKDMDTSFNTAELSKNGNMPFYGAACAFGVESLRKAAALPNSAEKDNMILNGYFALYLTGNTKKSTYAGMMLKQAFKNLAPEKIEVLSLQMTELSKKIDNYYGEIGRPFNAKDIMPWRHNAGYDILDEQIARQPLDRTNKSKEN
jgi:hypothetical protein